MARHGSVLLFAVLLAAGCGGNPAELTVVDRSLRAQQNTSTSGMSEFGASGGGQAAATLYWVEGRIKNSGTIAYTDVTVQFRVKDTGGTRVLTAQVPTVPAGKVVAFRTTTLQSHAAVTLLPDEAEIAGAKAD
jgi:hypothetical protein